MGFRNGAYASVFSVQKGNGNYYDVNIATSRKNRTSGQYETDFRGFVRFAGTAATGIASLDGQHSKNNGNRPISRVKLGDVDTTNSYSARDNRTYTHHVVFSFDFAGDSNRTVAPQTNTDQKTANDYANAIPDDEEGIFT